MKQIYSKPEIDVTLISLESTTCIMASVPENEAFTPVPGLWN